MSCTTCEAVRNRRSESGSRPYRICRPTCSSCSSKVSPTTTRAPAISCTEDSLVLSRTSLPISVAVVFTRCVGARSSPFLPRSVLKVTTTVSNSPSCSVRTSRSIFRSASVASCFRRRSPSLSIWVLFKDTRRSLADSLLFARPIVVGWGPYAWPIIRGSWRSHHSRLTNFMRANSRFGEASLPSSNTTKAPPLTSIVSPTVTVRSFVGSLGSVVAKEISASS